MATGTDQAIGWGLVASAASIFIYYTVWVIILPFTEEDQAILQFFPPRFYAVLLPLLAGVIGLVIIGLFVVITMLKSKPKAKQR